MDGLQPSSPCTMKLGPWPGMRRKSCATRLATAFAWMWSLSWSVQHKPRASRHIETDSQKTGFPRELHQKLPAPSKQMEWPNMSRYGLHLLMLLRRIHACTLCPEVWTQVIPLEILKMEILCKGSFKTKQIFRRSDVSRWDAVVARFTRIAPSTGAALAATATLSGLVWHSPSALALRTLRGKPFEAPQILATYLIDQVSASKGKQVFFPSRDSLGVSFLSGIPKLAARTLSHPTSLLRRCHFLT